MGIEPKVGDVSKHTVHTEKILGLAGAHTAWYRVDMLRILPLPSSIAEHFEVLRHKRCVQNAEVEQVQHRRDDRNSLGVFLSWIF